MSYSGNAADTGKKRVLGLMVNTGDIFPAFAEYSEAVKRDVQACGGASVFAAIHDFNNGQAAASSQDGNYNAQKAPADMADFRQKGVTTIVWPAGLENEHASAGAIEGYVPEYLFGSDGYVDDADAFSYHNPAAAAHSVLFSMFNQLGPAARTTCGEAVLSVAPGLSASDLLTACRIYPYFRHLATAIQVAGPRLSPRTINDGFRAIPEHTSSDPQTPACFYPAGEYNCVQDDTVEWWDPSGHAPNMTSSGCWRMMQGGARYPVCQHDLRHLLPFIH
ncbi:MAG: hypothetical protein ACYDGR_16390 [Candidatus Dormibacteria bacterium]